MIIDALEESDEKNKTENDIINEFSLEVENEDNILVEEKNIVEENIKEKEKENAVNKKTKNKHKLKYTELLNKLKHSKEKNHKNNEFLCNILLSPSEIDTSDEISTLSLLTYCYQENEKKELIYKIARILEEKQKKKIDIDPVFFLRVFFRAGYFLEKDEQYIYSIKYLKKCNQIKNKTKSETNLVNEYWNKSIRGIKNYFLETVKNFFKNDDFFSPKKCHEFKDLITSILNNNYKLNCDNIVYTINKKWLVNLNNFLDDYLTAEQNNTLEKLEEQSLDIDYFYNSYFSLCNENKKKETKGKETNGKETKGKETKGKEAKGKETKRKKEKNEKEEEEEKEEQKYFAFPGPIDNFSITDFKDYWHDGINIDENYFIKNELKLNENYYLINEKDWSLLTKYFGATNEIKKKANNLDLIPLEFILFDKRINDINNNMDLLKLRYIQMNKNSTIKQFKEKIMNIVVINLGEYKYKNSKSKSMEIINDADINIYFLNKKDKDILIEMCFSLYNDISRYDSLYIKQYELCESNMNDNISVLNKENEILLVEIIIKGEDNLFEDLNIKMKNEYRCTVCNNKINHINDKYHCEYCKLSLFCSEFCANQSSDHLKLDKTLKKIIEPKFSLSNLLSLKIESLVKRSDCKGRIGLVNIGNTCYFNSAIQCLSNTEDLTKYFLNLDYLKEINNGNASSSRGNISREYSNLIQEMWRGYGNAISPKNFWVTFVKKEDAFRNHEQQDSQEFLLSLLNNFHEDLNRVTNKEYKELNEKQKDETDEQASRRYWDYNKSREDSIIVDLFQGQYKTTIECTSCGFTSVTFDCYMNLQIPIPTKKLQNQIKFFTSDRKKIDLNINIDKDTEIKDLIEKAILYLDKKKYLNFLLYYNDKDIIFNYNNTKVPENILYDNIIIVEFDKKFRMNKIYKTSYKNTIGKNDDSTIYNKNTNYDFEIIPDTGDFNSCDKDKLSKIYDTFNNNKELVLFEKNLNFNDEDNYDIFVYPITEEEKKGIMNIKKGKKMVILSYPIIVTINKDSTLEELNSLIKSKFCINLKNNSEMELCFPHFTEKWENLKNTNNICPICGNKYDKTTKYCKIFDKYKKEDIISLLKIEACKGKPLILFAYSESYRKNSEVYKTMKLFNIDTKNEIDSNNRFTIYDSLALFNTEEILDGEEKWYCNKCKTHQKAKKTMEIYKTPYYLIVQLKRFKHRGALLRSILGSKNETMIDYNEILNLRDFVVGPDKDKSIYDLYGVVLHLGFLNGGHYIALCKNQNDWLVYDDKDVSYCRNPIQKDAYLLFYKRKSFD